MSARSALRPDFGSPELRFFRLAYTGGLAADMQRNVLLLKDRPWFDIPIVYKNGDRAILTLEKGAGGGRAFAQAFASWAR